MRLAALLATSVLACGDDGAGTDARPPIDAPPADPPFPSGIRDLTPELEPLRASGNLPALGAAIVEGGQVTALGVVGVRALGHPQAAWWDDRWHLGSDTKAMTAALTARLVERGVLRWDERLDALLPGVPMRPEYAAITPIELLAHRAGLPTDIPAAIWNPLWEDGSVLAQRRWFAEQMLGRAPAQPIGTFAYANAGYMILGAALEARTGLPWEQLLRDEVLGPLAMASCGYGMPDDGAVLEPWGHRLSGAEVVPVPPGRGDDNPPPLGPAGTVHCSLVDWARFVAANVAGANGDTSYLTTASWTRMHTPLGDEYALGWGVTTRSWAGGTVFVHAGSNTMNYCVVWAAPAIDRAFLVATNRGDAAAETDAVVGALINLAP